MHPGDLIIWNPSKSTVTGEKTDKMASKETADDSLYPIAVLIDELRNEDVQVRRSTVPYHPKLWNLRRVLSCRCATQLDSTLHVHCLLNLCVLLCANRARASLYWVMYKVKLTVTPQCMYQLVSYHHVWDVANFQFHVDLKWEFTSSCLWYTAHKPNYRHTSLLMKILWMNLKGHMHLF